MFIDEKRFIDYDKNVMNGRIKYCINPGKHTIQFIYFNNEMESLSTEKKEFEILNDKPINLDKKIYKKKVNIKIEHRTGAEQILQIIEDNNTKQITIILCFDDKLLNSNMVSLNSNQISLINSKPFIQQLALFSLYYNSIDKSYEKIDSVDKKNKLILSFIKANVDVENSDKN